MVRTRILTTVHRPKRPPTKRPQDSADHRTEDCRHAPIRPGARSDAGGTPAGRDAAEALWRELVRRAAGS